MFKPAKTISLTLALIVFISSMFQSFSLEEAIPQGQGAFKDISPNFWASDAIKWLAKSGAIKGFSDGTFRPDESITRAQFAQVVSNSLRLDLKDASNQTIFSDVSADSWASKAVQSIYSYLSWYKVGETNYFRPDEPATRVDIAVAMAKILELKTDMDVSSVLLKYSDENQISPELKKYVAATVENKIMTGFASETDKMTFKPMVQITRAQMVQLLYNAIVKNHLAGDRSLLSSGDTQAGAPVESVLVNTYKVIVDTENNYVGKIGDEFITQSEYYFFLKQVKAQMERIALQSGQQDLVKYWSTLVDGKDPKEVAKENTFAKIKEYKVELIQANNENVSLGIKEMAEVKADFDSLLRNNGGEELIATRLAKDFGISLAAYRKVYINSRLIEKFMTDKQQTMPIVEAELSKFYDQNKESFDSVSVVHVLFMTLDPNSGQVLSQEKQDLAKKNAEDVLQKVNQGGDIVALAKTLSEDPGVAENEGEYTFQKNHQMVKEFEDWAFSKKIGDTGIVKTNYGYHVMKKIRESGFEEAKDSITQTYQRNKLLELLNTWKEDKKNTIVRNDGVYKGLQF